MNENTVVLPLKDYNDLRDYKRETESGKDTLSLGNYYGREYRETITFIHPDETSKKLLTANKELSDRNDALSKEISKLNREIHDLKSPAPKEITIRQVKKMSVWEFMKWKRS